MAIVAASCSVFHGCDEAGRDRPERPSAKAIASAAKAMGPATPSAKRPKAPPGAQKPVEAQEPPEQPDPDAGAAAHGFILSDLNDVGPAGPATASPVGVVMVTRKDEVAVAKLRGGLQKGRQPTVARFDPVTQEAEAFYPYGVGPAVVGKHAYWITGGRLVRRDLQDEGKLEVLATDARSGARVAAAPRDAVGPKAAPAVVAYIAQQGNTLVAKLWIQGGGTHQLSPEGTAANSVALARTASGLLAVSLEGRSGMSPVHARTIELSGSKPKLGEDVVVRVGGPAQQLTEIAAVGTDGDKVWAFLPIERDITRFGLARIAVEIPPRMNADTSWRAYPNGLDPAPVACARICGKPSVAYVRPTDRSPHAPQELHLASVLAEGLGPSGLVAQARAFANVSLTGYEEGGMVAYVADRRTWVRALQCGPTKRGASSRRR